MLKQFNILITAKAAFIKGLIEAENIMKKAEAEYKVIADAIVKEVQDLMKKQRHPQSCPESCPESCPDCDCNEGGVCQHCGKDAENHVHPDVELPQVPGPESA